MDEDIHLIIIYDLYKPLYIPKMFPRSHPKGIILLNLRRGLLVSLVSVPISLYGQIDA